jgi:DNA repair exonuclease SbcCD nuclease subunit
MVFVRALFIGDIHIKFNNLGEVDKVISYIKKNVDTSRIDAAILAGDILDTHGVVHTQLMNKAYELINSLTNNGVHTYVLVGNHDYIDNSQFCSDNHWMAGVKGVNKSFTIVDSPIAIFDGTLVLVPYVPNGRFKEALNLYLDENTWTSARCIFAHQEFRGCKMGAIVSENGDEWDESLPHVISGHIHEKQRPQKNIYYPGSAINHSFGNDSQGISIFSVETRGDIREECIDMGFEKKRIEYITVEEAQNRFERDELVLKKNFKYSLEGTRVEIAEFKKTTTYKSIIKVCKVVFRERKVNDADKKARPVKRFTEILYEKVVGDSTDKLVDDYKIIIPKI